MSVTAYIALGSNKTGNMGDRIENVRQAIVLLGAHPQITIKQSSCLYETEPIGMRPDDEGEWFVNAVTIIETDLSPWELLAVCLSIERELGRHRQTDKSQGFQSRSMDIDILFYANQVHEAEGLQIPHPRLQERAFVLVPLLELAPDLHHPVLGKSIRQLHLELSNPEEVRLLDFIHH